MTDEYPPMTEDEARLLASWITALLNQTTSRSSDPITLNLHYKTAHKLASTLAWLARYDYHDE